MTTSTDEKLPFLMDLQTNSKADEIQALRTEFEKQSAPGNRVIPQTKFDLAYTLIKSPFKKDQEEGLKLLHELYKEHPARRRECLYYLSIGNYKLAQYVEARKFNEILLQMEPRNAQSLRLRDLIDSKVRSDGMIGIAIVGGLVASVVAVGFAMLGGKRK
ncbi:mitochondrial membrane protein [Chytriomyces hyalinus]|nr:mitochondrial membrane protein [Chytriomyces hyalinus]KAJ3252853.1 mitochondrial membrane protein [Chytriomyces hyalinus]